MYIYISINNQNPFKLEISQNDSIIDVKKKARKIQPFFLFDEMKYKGKKLEDSNTISYYQIREGDTLNIIPESIGACIDKLKDEVDTNIGFDLSLLKRNELHVNLIHFDSRMTNSENYGYYNRFKVDVIGGFYALDDLEILKEYLNQIKQKNIPFIVITSGSSGKDVIPLCKKYSFIKEVIIFCLNYSYNKHYIDEYPGYVKKVFTSISSVYDYIKTFGADKYKEGIEKFKFSLNDIKMDKQFIQTPVITSSEYDNCYFLIHRAYAYFFGNMDDKNESPKFKDYNLNKIIESLNKLDIKANVKTSNLEKFKSLVNIKDNNTFVENAIRAYTAESGFCYLYNKMMRDFDPGLISLAYYMGPFLYGLNKYIKENPNVAMSKDMNLSRIIEISKIDFYLYKLNLGHIICFPSLSSSSSKDINFTPTETAAQYSNINQKEKLKIKLIIKYKYKPGNISPGIILENKIGHSGKYLSCIPYENEVLLLPFTFFKITNINEKGKLIELEIINRTSYIEYTLKNDVNNRTLFSNLG